MDDWRSIAMLSELRNRLRPIVYLSLATVCIFNQACSRSEAGGLAHELASARGPHLTTVDSVTLSEPDSAPLGARSYLARHRNGSIYVSDVERGRIFHYRRDGSLEATFGRSGGGPGEFKSAGVLALLQGDSLLAVMDAARKFISLLDSHSGKFIRGFRVPFQDVGQIWTVHGDTAVFAIRPSASMFGIWNWRTEQVSERGKLPTRLLRAGSIYALYGRLEVVPRDSGFVAQVPTEPGVELLDGTGKAVGYVAIPAARRRGTPPDLVAREMKLAGSGKRFQFLASVAAGLQRLQSGEIAVLNVDADVLRPPPKPEGGNLRYFMSVLSPDLSRACIDAEVMIPNDAVATLPTFLGDSLLMLSRVVTPQNLVRTVLYTVGIATDGCEWIPTGGIRPPRNDD